jgi:hypothetical protein
LSSGVNMAISKELEDFKSGSDLRFVSFRIRPGPPIHESSYRQSDAKESVGCTYNRLPTCWKEMLYPMYFFRPQLLKRG